MSTTIVVPELGESVISARVGRWLKSPGETVAAGEAVVELETEKVNLEVAAQRDGTLVRIDRNEGDDVKPGDVLGEIDESRRDGEQPRADRHATGTQQPAPPPPVGPSAQPEARPAPTPLARRMAEDNRVDVASLAGTGAGGRVTRADVERHLEGAAGQTREAAPPPATPLVPEAPPAHVPSERIALPTGAAEERVRMSVRRQTIARRLVEAQQTSAALTTFNEVDMTAVMALRRRVKASFSERYGVSLGIVSFFVKASIAALRAFPILNAEVDGEQIVLKRHYDIGVAIAAPDGLVVPVIHQADRLSLADIERWVTAASEKAGGGNLSLDDLRGGTFTITNGGIFGSLFSTPILNPPQVGILGLHRIEDRPVAREGQVVVRPMMYVALTYDHRIVDGREAVQFLVRIRDLVEDPERLLLEA